VSLEYGYEALAAWFNDELNESTSLVQKLSEAVKSDFTSPIHLQGRAFSLFIVEGDVIVVHHQLLNSDFLADLLGEQAASVSESQEDFELPDDELHLDEDSLHSACGYEDFVTLFQAWLEEN
jgi:uncharacterized protein YacL (UPF0231 family)